MKVSVVTVHRNDFSGLERTMGNVANLRARFAIEWIVIDGLSSWPTDDLRERVTRAADTFISESDTGLYDAMNKGAALCSGELISFMNAGDTFCDAAADLLALCADPEVDVFCFDSYELSAVGIKRLKSARLARWIWYGMPGHHQAMIFRASALPSLVYDLKYRIAADYALLCGLYRAGRRIKVINEPLCVFELGGASTVHRKLGLAEQQMVRYEVLGISPLVNQPLKWVKELASNFRTLFPSAYAFLRYRPKRK